MRWITIFLLFTSTLKAQSPLCASRPTNFCCEYVNSVTINGKTYGGSNGYTSSSGGNPAGYYDYTSTSVPSITAGQSISISYTAQTNGNYMEYFKLWIDFNGNGVLTDAGELINSYINIYSSNISLQWKSVYEICYAILRKSCYMWNICLWKYI